MGNLRTHGIRHSRRPRQNNQSTMTDCFFFVYFGTCGFGLSCKFKHPVRDTHPRVDGPAITQPYPMLCKHFLQGNCKFGSSCFYDHSFPIPQLNFSLHFNASGFPKRWGKPDCYFYMRNGTCGYGTRCMFHHPEPGFYYPVQGYGSYVGGGVEYQNRFSQANYGWIWKPITIRDPCVTLNDVGLPLRPEKKACWYYESGGRCRFGKGCKFNHPNKCLVNGNMNEKE